MDPILDIRGISKRFTINRNAAPYLSFRDKLSHIFASKQNDREDFWALSDVSFTVNPGESIGIIGKNGAGKSTLLKIFSRITPPTRGSIVCRGRMASLLEVGTGFHPELTGRENIFLNGSILGMKKREIAVQFDAIVDFAGTEKFLDTPLKHYSSGMQLRLAFAVAAFLEPEILVIDEVLAVGDAEFQKKCMGKMEDVSKSGRTILFVSHNLGAVSKLCSRSILLRQGKLDFVGPTNDAIRIYSDNETKNSIKNFDHPIVKSLQVFVENGNLVLAVKYEKAEDRMVSVGYVISDQFGAKIFGANPHTSDFALPREIPAEGTVRIEIVHPKLRSGVYQISIWIGDGYIDFFQAEDCLVFHIEDMTALKIKTEGSKVGPVISETRWLYENSR